MKAPLQTSQDQVRAATAVASTVMMEVEKVPEAASMINEDSPATIPMEEGESEVHTGGSSENILLRKNTQLQCKSKFKAPMDSKLAKIREWNEARKSRIKEARELEEKQMQKYLKALVRQQRALCEKEEKRKG